MALAPLVLVALARKVTLCGVGETEVDVLLLPPRYPRGGSKNPINESAEAADRQRPPRRSVVERE